MAVQCKIDIPAVPGLQDNQLTVGREFLLACEGEFPRDLHPDKVQVVLKPEEKYSIHLMSFEFRSPTAADLKVTAYRAGQIHFDNLQVTDGTQTLSLGPVQYQVETVLQQPEGGQQAPPEPYGAFGPADLPVPAVYGAILLAALGFVALFVAFKIYRVVQRRSMLEKLREHDAAMSPLAQFHQTLRRLQRSNAVFFGVPAKSAEVQRAFETLHEAFLLFLTRQYKVPAVEWNERLVLKDIKKYHRGVYTEFADPLKKLYKEFGHGLKDKQKLTESDVLNLTKSTRALVEKMEAFK